MWGVSMEKGMRVFLIFLVSLGISACTTTGSNHGNDKSPAAKGGEILGGVFAGIAKAGHAIGNAITEVLDEAERHMLASATKQATTSKANQRVAWSSRSKKTGKVTKGYVIPGEVYTRPDGQTCREIKQVVEKDGKNLVETKLACKTAQGWETSAI
jgi:surface antigen